MNSVRPECYHAYFRPVGYTFPDVLESIDRALGKGRFVSINYLNCPGFTDTPEERDALAGFLHRYPIRMIQWRNLNYDPVKYWRRMHRAAPSGPPLGMDRLLRDIRHRFPKLVFGYFNPPKERFHRGLLTVSK